MVFICEVYWWFGVEYNVTSFFFNFDIYFNSLYCISRNGNNTSRIGYAIVGNKDLNDLKES